MNTIPDMTCTACKKTITAFSIVTSHVDAVSCQIADLNEEKRYETDYYHDTTKESDTKVYCICGKQVTNEQIKYILSLKEE